MLENMIESTLKKLRVPLLATAMTVTSLGLFQGCEKQDSAESRLPVLENHGKLYFVGRQQEIADIATLWTSNSDGSGLKKLGEDLCHLGEIEVSPDGTKVVYPKNQTNIIIDKEGVIKGEFSTATDTQCPSWTPDSKSILYSIYSTGIYRYDIETNNITRIVHSSNATYDEEPTMSPITGKIAFVHHTFGNIYDIYIVNSKGDSLNVAASGWPTFHDDYMGVTWLDKSHLFYMNRKQGKLFYVDVDTKKRIEIDPNLGQMGMARVSPDKQTIALVIFYKH